jgi:hypothetical protein
VLKVTTTPQGSYFDRIMDQTVIDPQPNEIHFDQPTKPNQTHLRFHLIM